MSAAEAKPGAVIVAGTLLGEGGGSGWGSSVTAAPLYVDVPADVVEVCLVSRGSATVGTSTLLRRTAGDGWEIVSPASN